MLPTVRKISLFALGLLLALAETAVAAPPSCAPFSDSGCVFGETFDDGSSPPSGWGVSTQMLNVSGISTVAPGLNGSPRAVRIRYSGHDQDFLADSTAINDSLSNGAVRWIEFSLKYGVGFEWGMSQTPGA